MGEVKNGAFVEQHSGCGGGRPPHNTDQICLLEKGDKSSGVGGGKKNEKRYITSKKSMMLCFYLEKSYLK